jgi:hypothetical protein
MADEHGRWIIREITDVIATATEHGRRRSTGEQLPHHERVQLQRRKVTVLHAIATRSPSARGVQQAIHEAESQLACILAEPSPARAASTPIHVQGPTP